MGKKQTVLVVDDIETNRKILSNFLIPLGYRVFEVKDGKEALNLVFREKPDILLLDLIMPEMNGFEVCRIIKSNPETKMIPVIVITGLNDDENHQKALEAGADDFLTKPFNLNFLKARLKSLSAIKMLNDLNLKYQKTLEESNIELLKKLIQTQDITIFALAKLAESRDPETGEHLERMREYVKILTLEIKNLIKYSDYITDRYIENIYKSTPLHDIGKVGIPDSILLKPSSLTGEEFEIMKRHTIIGGDSITAATKHTGMSRSFLDMGKDIAYYHHEKWDGKGYPKGLIGENIPLSARLTALADVYDALTTRRVYKPAYSHDESKRIISEGAGKSFDPDIVEAFFSREKDFLTAKDVYRDKDTSS